MARIDPEYKIVEVDPSSLPKPKILFMGPHR